MVDDEVRTLAERAIDVARSAGASYADARYLSEESESIDVENGRVEGVSRGADAGIGVRVLVDGAWGFAGTALLEPGEIEHAATLAVEIARSSRALLRAPVRLADEPPVETLWQTEIAEDPFAVSLDEKIDLLLKASAEMQSVSGLTIAQATMDFWRRHSFLATSEGARIEQIITQSGAGLVALAVGDREVQQRSFPNSFRGHFATKGYEHVRAMDLADNAARIAEEAVALHKAPECPSMVTTVVLDPTQLCLQVHESVGHPLELDRVLGMEAAYAGTSFVRPEDRGSLRYGSDEVTITCDSTLPGALGSYGYDDEGVPSRRQILIEGGVLQRFLSSRETAPVIGETRSNGTMRADGWGVIPLIRMPNINLEPGTSSFEEMIATTDDGIYMTTNLSWSIDDKRTNFQFGTEVAYEIKKGKLGKMLRNPNYAGKTLEFWSSCDALGGPDEWKVYGTPNCGKGQPGQVARVAHGTSPGRFRNVQVGVRG
ncbi:MAG: TldD/PmbA family protein [Actinomycetota bacterium]